MRSLTVAAVQMDCIPGDKTHNLTIAEGLIQDAVDAGAELIVLPELFTTGYHVEKKDLALAETVPGEATKRLADISARHNVALIGGMIESGDLSGLIYNTAIVIENGKIKSNYQKRYLWQEEQLRFGKGKGTEGLLSVKNSYCGIQICYEVGFPELTRAWVNKGAELLLVPSAFSEQRAHVWDITTRSRALENGMFVVAANRTGTDAHTFAGRSRIVSPQGKLIKEASSDQDEAIVTTIDFNEVAEQRHALPYLRDLNQ
ncbi:carbon-nitrogen hydrolase family protein [Salicibibacter cibi]|uniref:Carbon-nitrogen hydrolase family protein n=1 Tax=Salicibibacter cibi TaxID=2743001 RepID=A0A7T6Z9N6_9BACI|nr:carbon-nitrogen hydrolase family protein [Salicibibacter cibi]QQK79401.1 carbon-nitrogen hydrolase family protein [Salicibibacter cibi]